MRLFLAVIVLASALPGTAFAQCPCMNWDPYAKLSPEEHRAKFDELLSAASASYGRLMATVRAGNLKQAKADAADFVIEWAKVADGFWVHPPRGLESSKTWLKWFPEARARFGEGTQLILSADDLHAARPLLEGGRWALVRIREENNAAGLPDLVLRARGVQEEIRQALASRNQARTEASCRRLGELTQAAAKMPGPSSAAEWCEKARALTAAPSAATLAPATEAANRLNAELGDRLN